MCVCVEAPKDLRWLSIGCSTAWEAIQFVPEETSYGKTVLAAAARAWVSAVTAWMLSEYWVQFRECCTHKGGLITDS